MRVSLLAILLSMSCYGQWITGYYEANNDIEPVLSIPWSKYTHLIHFAAAAGVDQNGSGDASINMQYLVQSEIAQLIASKPQGKKVIFELGDDGAHPTAFAENTAPGMVEAFVNNTVNFVNSNGYDGVDIDWETKINVGQYQQFVSMLRNAMPDKVITVSAGNWGGMEAAIAGVSASLDQVNVMCYDMDNNREYSWYNDALLPDDNWVLGSCAGRIGQITAAGVPSSKIGVGIPFYGRINQGVTGPAVPGDFPQVSVTYRDLVSNSAFWQVGSQQYDWAHKSDYLIPPGLNVFVSYNGPQSIVDMVAWARSQGFGGFSTFVIDYEYLPYAVGDAKYPLSTALYNAVFGSTDSTWIK